MIWRMLRSLLFCLPAETAHQLAMSSFDTAMKVPGIGGLIERQMQVYDHRLAVSLFGLDFPNPVGLAAGFDKDARWYKSLAQLGFGHVEVGTVTAHPQPGNPRPRLFRLPRDRALINRMGFNNQGSSAAAVRLLSRDIESVIGINLGKSRITPLPEAAGDYNQSFRRLFPFASYFTINVSSPNTPGLRNLQNRRDLQAIIAALQASNEELSERNEMARRPLLLKVAPDLSDPQLEDIAELAGETRLSGVIATNTTTERQSLLTRPSRIRRIGDGGLSGKPLFARSCQVVRLLYERLPTSIPVVGCGGIMSGEDAWIMLQHGAALLQVYSGFIYNGPSFVRQINRYLAQQLQERQLESILQVVGERATSAGL